MQRCQNWNVAQRFRMEMAEMERLAQAHIEENARVPFTHVWVWHSYNMMLLAGYDIKHKLAEVMATQHTLSLIPLVMLRTTWKRCVQNGTHRVSRTA